MNNQQLNNQFNPNQFGQNNVKFTTILQNFLTNFLNFSGKASRKEFWYPTLTFWGASTVFLLLTLIAASLSFSSAISSFERNDFIGGTNDALDGLSTVGSMLGVYLSFAIYSIIFSIAYFSAHVRRLRDAGFSNSGILAIYGVYYVLVIFSGFPLTIIWNLIMYIALPLLPTKQVETNNNDGFSKFMFQQNPEAAAYYAQQGNPGYGFNPHAQQGFNQAPVNNAQTPQQGFNQAPVNNAQAPQQGFNQAPVNNAQAPQQGFNQAPVNNEPLVKTPVQETVAAEVKTEAPKVETPKVETPKVEKTENVNPFGDQVFKK